MFHLYKRKILAIKSGPPGLRGAALLRGMLYGAIAPISTRFSGAAASCLPK